MNRNLLSFTAAILLLAACRHQENASQLKAINECLQRSNSIVQDGNKLYYEAIEEKFKDPRTHRDAETWEPRAVMVIKRTDSIVLFIEKLKSELLKQSDSLRKANTPVVEQLYETNGDGYVLLNKLATFKESIPGIIRINDFSDKPYLVTNLKRDLGFILDTISLLPGYRDSLSESQRNIYKKKWVEENFAGSTSLLTMMQLNKIKSEVLASERTLVSYFNSQIRASYICGGPFPFTIINSSYVKSGQSIEVCAGILQFTVVTNPSISINGKEIKLDSDDRAVYKFTAEGKPGKHIIPVSIVYYKPDGTQEQVGKNIEYIIADK
jgi:hypothetical protein